MKRYFYIVMGGFVTGILILILSGCAIPKEKHFYLKHGQKGFIHAPTIYRDEWMTFEIKAPEYEEVK